ncbi:hypothetical protein [Amycolatopsis sp. FDAARGOS 1241]|uniref:hypothetical protein n=1 Tax=Amycolatopsis sp. FDAARGOS 1241 TaxID=2778070 RepID=UPI00194F0516|nr:hypothetical protein [Amycolatopsis sp. FDAARGOS 1241]QRP47959.1 hypothetical protein I6J71_08735 [Amycolatopsis sp. FDAARGOS 1241]
MVADTTPDAQRGLRYWAARNRWLYAPQPSEFPAHRGNPDLPGMLRALADTAREHLPLLRETVPELDFALHAEHERTLRAPADIPIPGIEPAEAHLAYVAVTRARHRLDLCALFWINQHPIGNPTDPGPLAACPSPQRRRPLLTAVSLRPRSRPPTYCGSAAVSRWSPRTLTVV